MPWADSTTAVLGALIRDCGKSARPERRRRSSSPVVIAARRGGVSVHSTEVDGAAIDSTTTVVSVVVLGFMGLRLVSGVRASRSARGRTIVSAVLRRLGWRHVWPIPLVLAAVLAVAYTLMLVPGLDWGWWSALGGDGNPVFGSSDQTAGTAWEWALPLCFIALLIPGLPLFANAEERLFRTGAERWSTRRRVVKTLQFGLVHALIGIPIGAALALSLGGAYFMWTYLRTYRATGSPNEATLESTAAHTAYNGVLVAVVALGLVLYASGV
jgi:hypothetical protein